MRTRETSQVQSVTATSPATATTSVAATLFKGDMLRRAEILAIDASLVAGTGGTLDVYLQRKLGSNDWADWVHFPQLNAGVSKRFTLSVTGRGTTIVEVGGGTDAAPGVALAAGTAVDVIPGDDVRIVFVSGAGTSAGASNKVTITPYTERQ